MRQVVDPFATQAQRDAQAAQIADGRAQLAKATADLVSGQAQLDAAKAKLVDGQAEIDANIAKLVDGQAQLDAAKALFPKATVAAKQAEIDAGTQKLADGQAGIDAGWATIRDKQAQIDAAPAQIATQTHKLEGGATLLDLSSGVRLVSEDGSAAVAAVMFDAAQTAVPAETKDGLMAAFTATPVDGVGVDFSTSIATGMPEVVGPARPSASWSRRSSCSSCWARWSGPVCPSSRRSSASPSPCSAPWRCPASSRWCRSTPVLAIMLGLAVGIDYALFIVNRHRRQLMAATACANPSASRRARPAMRSCSPAPR